MSINYINKSVFFIGVSCLITSYVLAIENIDQQAELEELLEIGIEELANIKLTTASRKEQKIMEVSAAVYVIDQEEISRSGMNSLPELLRLVPGLQVAQINSSNWAITSRGFNSQYSNKLLVLMDGRTLYSPLFAGVNWNIQNIILDNVERIEVIRGPGGTLWGSNAVNGIINIITKKTIDTQGAFSSASVGSPKHTQGELRFGDKLNENAAYRIYAKNFYKDGFRAIDTTDSEGDWRGKSIGFRIDWQLSNKDNFTIQGDKHDVNVSQDYYVNNYPINQDKSDKWWGHNFMLRWNINYDDTSSSIFQIYHDRTVRTQIETRDIDDLDFQHSLIAFNNHQIIFGGGFRLSTDQMVSKPVMTWNPSSSRESIINFFIQDEFPITSDLHLTLGTKFEHNENTQWEIQPNIRLLWNESLQQTYWIAVSRASRIPSRTETGFMFNMPIPGEIPSTLLLQGNSNVRAEKLISYEFGYRNRYSDKLFLDIATFYNIYTDIMDFEYSGITFNPNPVITQHIDNNVSAHTYGLETAIDWQILDNWKLRTSYTFLELQTKQNSSTTILSSYTNNPQHQAQLRSFFNLTNTITFDTSFFYISKLEGFKIPAYWRADLRLGWRPNKKLELSLTAQNLFDSYHAEFEGISVKNSLIPRSIFANIEVNF